MVAQTQFDPQNPNALFSPDQWSNQFSNFNNAALPWPSSYVGTPTNAMGQPIQPPPGTTLNSAPAAASTAPAAPAAPSATSWNPTMGLQSLANMSGKPVQSSAGGVMPTGQNTGLDHPQYIPSSYVYPQAAAPQAAPQAAAPAAPNNWQNTMAMLANPGKVTTPGATVPATASAQPGPGSLQAFLQNWKPAQSGPGSGFQQGFAGSLKGMGY